MTILFLTLFRIENLSQRDLYADLIKELSSRGHSVYVVTPTERRYGEKGAEIVGDGVRILRVKTLNIQKTNVIEKGIGTLLLERQYMRAIKKHWGDIRFDLCIYSTPPIAYGRLLRWQKSLGAGTYLMLKDIFPQNAVDLGMLKEGGLLHKMFLRKEKSLYKLSDRIGCMSEANRAYLLSHNQDIATQRVNICPNSIYPVEFPHSIDRNQVRRKYGLPLDKPVFVCGGNLGKPIGIDFLIETLQALNDSESLHICVVGSGTEYMRILDWQDHAQPKSVSVIDELPKDEYDQLLGAADVGMIFLDARFTIPNFPSRLLSYLEFALPVVLSTDVNTDIGKVAQAGGFGLWSKSGDLKALVVNMEVLASNRALRLEMGKRGREYLKEHFSPKITVDAILDGEQSADKIYI